MQSTVLKFNRGLKARFKGVIDYALRLNSGCGGPDQTDFKKWGTAKQAQYFLKKDKELLKIIKDQMKDQIGFHEKQIAVHQDAIKHIKDKQKQDT